MNRGVVGVELQRRGSTAILINIGVRNIGVFASVHRPKLHQLHEGSIGDSESIHGTGPCQNSINIDKLILKISLAHTKKKKSTVW